MSYKSLVPRRVLGALLTAAALVFCTASLAAAVSEETTTGQTLTVNIGSVYGGDTASAHGTVTITEGTATVASATITLNGSDPVPLDLAEDGSFSVTMPFTHEEYVAQGTTFTVVATASDGTVTAGGVSQVASSPIDEVPAAQPPVVEPPKVDAPTVKVGTVAGAPGPTKVLPNTGLAAPRTLGPIGLLLVGMGCILMAAGRMSGSRRTTAENRVSPGGLLA